MSFWVTILEAWVPQLEIFHQMLRGCSHDKIALARVSYQDDVLILYYVYMMMGHFISRLFECTLHVDKIRVNQIGNIMHVPPIPVNLQTDLTPKQVVISRLHDAIVKFFTSLRYNNLNELTLG